MYNITLQQIETFLTIAKYKNISKVANSMYISQPALSKILKRFEEGLGFRLFYREGQCLVLTPEGNYLYTMLDPLYKNLNSIISYTSTLSANSDKILKIIVPSTYDDSATYQKIAAYIKKYEKTYEDILLAELFGDLIDLRRAVEFFEADLVICHDFVLSDIKNISYIKISEFTQYLSMSNKHPLAKNDDLNFGDLSGEILHMVRYVDDDRYVNNYLDECRSLGFLPKRIEFVPNLQTLYYNMRKMNAVSICGQYEHYIIKDDIKYFSLPETSKKKYLVVAWHTNQLTPEAKLFVDMIPGEIIKSE